jgi:antitoxin CptB
MRELDLLLEGFLEQRYEALSAADRDGFERLLECPNEDLMDWLMEGRSPEDEQLAGIVRQIRGGAMPAA